MPRKSGTINLEAVKQLNLITKSKSVSAAHLAKAKKARAAMRGTLLQCIGGVKVERVKDSKTYKCPKTHPHRGKGPISSCCFGLPIKSRGKAKGTSAGGSHAGLKAYDVCLPKIDKKGIKREQVMVSYKTPGKVDKNGKKGPSIVVHRCVQAGGRSARRFKIKSVTQGGQKASTIHEACPADQAMVQKVKVLPPQPKKGVCCKNIQEQGGRKMSKAEAAERKTRCTKMITCPVKTYVSCAKPKGKLKHLKAHKCKVGETLMTKTFKYPQKAKDKEYPEEFLGKKLTHTRCMAESSKAKGWKPVKGASAGKRVSATLLITHAGASGRKGQGSRTRTAKQGAKTVTLVKKHRDGRGKQVKVKWTRTLGKGTSRGIGTKATEYHDAIHAPKKAKKPAAKKTKKPAAKKAKKPAAKKTAKRSKPSSSAQSRRKRAS